MRGGTLPCGPAAAAPPQVVSTDSRVLFEALEGVFAGLSFSALADDVFRDLVLARVVEPTSALRLEWLAHSTGARTLLGLRPGGSLPGGSRVGDGWGGLVFIRRYEKESVYGLREHLLERVKAWQDYNVNCWQAALFEALAVSERFCTEGFRL